MKTFFRLLVFFFLLLGIAHAQFPSPELNVVGATNQSAVNINLCLAVADVVPLNSSGFHSISVAFIPTTGVTSGVISFECSQDNVNYVALPLYDQASLTNAPVTSFNPLTGTSRFFTGPVTWQYFRARVSTVIGGGGTVQAFTHLSGTTFQPSQYAIIQSSAAGLNSTVSGNVAVSSPATANPVGVGGRVTTTLDTTLVQGDVFALNGTDAGQVITKEFGSAGNDWNATSGITALATNTSTLLKAAGAAGIRNYCTGVQFYNTSATVSTTVSILDGATVIWTGFLPATTAALQVMPLQFYFVTPLRGTAATAMNIQLGTTAASVYYNVQGYQSF